MASNRRGNKSAEQVVQEKSQSILEGVAYWAAFYRANPQRFCKDYLNIQLKLFQKILIWAMMHYYYFIYIAARGQSKTWLTSLYCVVRCILFPKTKICVASATRSQGNEVLLKIKDDFCKNYGWGSANLNAEISVMNIGQNNAVIEFKNGSWIQVVTASDTGRGKRANVLVVDEFRMVSLDVINTVLRKFLTAPRTPNYLNNPQYEDRIERNVELYMSSAWYQSHWSFDKVKAFFVNMLDDTKKYFVCALPYQLSIYSGLLSREQVQDEMSEADFDPIRWQMEMGAEFYGDTDGAFFKYDDISKRRKIKQVFYDPEAMVAKNMKVPDVLPNERRIMSADVALLSSKKRDNDAAALQINRAMATDQNRYVGNVVYFENQEGLTTDALGLRIMRLFYFYKCTDLALDVKGLGVGVFDFIIKDQYDPETGVTYPALTLAKEYSDSKWDEYRERCQVKNAKKCIHPMMGSQTFNTEICTLLRTGIQEGRINLPVSEFIAEEYLKSEIKGFSKLTIPEQTVFKMPYIQTSLAINELICLEHEVKGMNIKIYERSGMRKDRYSSLAYNYYVQVFLERQLKPKKSIEQSVADRFPIKQATRHTMF